MDEKQFKSLQNQLERMTRLLTLLALKGEEKESVKITLLDSIGFRPSEIARILNKSLSNVTTVLTSVRKKSSLASDEEGREPSKNDEGKRKLVE